MILDDSQRALLHAMRQGAQLRDHRDIEGVKRFMLVRGEAGSTPTPAEVVEALVDLGLVSSNKKFPSATYWLTDLGARLAARMSLH